MIWRKVVEVERIKVVGGDNKPLAVGEQLYIPEWFQSRFNTPYYATKPYHEEPMTIIGETEKAWKVRYDTETVDGEKSLVLEGWVPKSVGLNKAGKNKEREEYKKKLKQQRKNYEAGVQKYEKMLGFAKKNGVKGVRKGMRKETILKKIHDAGHKYEY